MWRSVRRKSRHVSTEGEYDGDRNVEMKDLLKCEEPSKSKRRSTAALVLPLNDSLDSNGQRFVPFSAPKKNGRGCDDDVQIFVQAGLESSSSPR